MIRRSLQPLLAQLFSQYPVVTVTGPRQSGKTTLCRGTFPDLEYINLERPDERQFALEDPRGFLQRFPDGAILDEIQRAPELTSYLQAEVDSERRNGRFVLTGSQQFNVIEAVSQSLVGRTALLRLLPFSIPEAAEAGADLDPHTMIFTGFYPRIYDQRLDPAQALGDYFETYVERDVRQISEIRQLNAFRTFVRLCAGRVGQVLNLQRLSNDAGVSHTTARQWLSVLEASYLVFRLEPYFANLGKRLVKSPKLYFYDVGLAANLLQIEHPRQIVTHPLKGALYENMMVVEALKHRYNQGRGNNLLFYRDSSGLEVDLLCSIAGRLIAVEIKAGATLQPSFLRPLKTLANLMPEVVEARMLVYSGPSGFQRSGVHVVGPATFAAKLEELSRAV